jgi:hypothetical protein
MVRPDWALAADAQRDAKREQRNKASRELRICG